MCLLRALAPCVWARSAPAGRGSAQRRTCIHLGARDNVGAGRTYAQSPNSAVGLPVPTKPERLQPGPAPNLARMTGPADVLTDRLQRALGAAFGPEYAATDPVLRPSQFADFQANVALALAKRLGSSPRAVAERPGRAPRRRGRLPAPPRSAARASSTSRCAATGWPSGRPRWPTTPGSASRRRSRRSSRSTTPRPTSPRRCTSGTCAPPSSATRWPARWSTSGHRVVRQNHIGDWGTPFGMLIEHLLDVGEDSARGRGRWSTDPNAFYQAARAKFDPADDGGFADRARRRVVALQAGDPDTLRLWQELIDLSTSYFNSIYADARRHAHRRGPGRASRRYNDELAGICDELEAAGIATVSDGALCVFLDGYTGREGKPVPLIIRKSDGGYGYATTDLATDPAPGPRPQRGPASSTSIGAPQALHLQMVFDDRAQGRLAARRRRGRARPDRQRARPRRQDPQDPQRRAGPADARCSTRRSSGPRAVLAEARPELARRRARGDRPPGRHRRGEVRRPVGRPRQRVHLRLRPDGWRSPATPAPTCSTPRRGSARSCARPRGRHPPSGRSIAASTEEAERALALALLGFGEVVEQVGRHARAAPAVRLPLRPRPDVHHVLRARARCCKAADAGGRAPPGSRCAR